MSEELSKINVIFEELGEVITHDSNFNKVPIKWAMYELTPNNMPPTVIVFEAKPFQYDDTGCHYERQLDILIIHNTNYPREITKRLSKYAEQMVELLDTHIKTSYSNYELEFFRGSEIRATRNNREDAESYKGSKTLFSSLIVLSYLVRY